MPQRKLQERNERLQLSAAVVTLLLAGCSGETGILLQVTAAIQPTSVQAGIAKLELVTARRSYCERWVEDQGASRMTVDVHTRDLAKSPYELLVRPTHFTDLSAPVDATVLALDASGAVIGSAYFEQHPFEKGAVNRYMASIELLARTGQDKPLYVSGDGCVCLPGQPWRGNGSGSGCDLDVVTSFDRLVDTAGCELAQGKRELMGPVCDGQSYGEPMDRRLPCFANGPNGCAIAVRNCHDADGRAYDGECTPDGNSVAPPTGALCAAYFGCEQQACGDLIGCFLASKPPEQAIACVLRVDDTTPAGMPIKPCADGKWEASLDVGTAALTGAECVASVIEGRDQPPFQLGLLETGVMGARTATKQCPPTLVVEGIGADSPADVPALKELDLTIGDHVVHVKIDVIRGCVTGPSLVCHRG
jgi:hypothetical protein